MLLILTFDNIFLHCISTLLSPSSRRYSNVGSHPTYEIYHLKIGGYNKFERQILSWLSYYRGISRMSYIKLI
ncbi:hypothetical protein GCM10007916_12980 [Psychromonas marina]|uniref:Uncharacterized protein n=1 Tax=Psychromonas marina TaxID=88364 RepID=A0ABQ6DYI9_9GAMM|nr:hypothetical protein GCM10007916_12980 [Psychromonas marina]